MPASAPGPQSEPIAAADVAATFAEVAAGSPLSGILDVGGPGIYTLDEPGRITLTFKGDERSVTVDDTAGMFAPPPCPAPTSLRSPERRSSRSGLGMWLRS
jgi:uncharacterized protein YbjT (DUF2867 family)